MTIPVLEPVDASDLRLKGELLAPSLPVNGFEDGGRSFYALRVGEDAIIGYSGLETFGDNDLLRSMVISSERRGQGFGHLLAELTIAKAAPGTDVYPVTAPATPFFYTVSFELVSRFELPTAILSTLQPSGSCPASATNMKSTRPPT